MSIHLVGFSRDVAIQLTSAPIFHADSEVRGDAVAGSSEVRFRCGKGQTPRTVEDCEACPRFRGWRQGPTTHQLSARCRWSPQDPVRALMTDVRALVTVAPTTPWAIADARAAEAGVHHLPVLEDGKLVGLLARSDLLPHPPPGDPVAARMRTEVLALRHSATVAEAVATMVLFRVGCLPVIQDGAWLAGLVTRGDLRRVGVPEELLAIRRCTRCGGEHGMSTPQQAAPRTACAACMAQARDAGFSLVVLGEPE